MTCSRCSKRTSGNEVIAMVVVGSADAPVDDARFTGIVWCADCLPEGGDGDQIREDMRAVESRR